VGPADEPVEQRQPHSRYCNCPHNARTQPDEQESVTTRILVSGHGDVKRLNKALSSVATIEAFDSGGKYLDENGMFQVAVLSRVPDDVNVCFALHTIDDHGFQVVDVKQSHEHHIRCKLFPKN
jgi:hypothetical protein